MTKDEALKLALEALDYRGVGSWRKKQPAITAIKEALAQPKYRRGDRLICLETEEYCVIHISGTDRQWVKFPTSYIGVYTNEQVAELFELLPKEPEQEPDYSICPTCGGMALDPIVPKLERFTSPQGTWVELTDDEIKSLDLSNYVQVVRIVQAKLKEKNT